MTKSIKIVIFGLLLLVSIAGTAIAQETTSAAPATNSAVSIDENIQAKDLGVSEPTILPNNPLYFFKNLSRAIQNIITVDPVKKAVLKEKIASEKLIETQKLVEKGAKAEVVQKAITSYQKDVEQINAVAQKIKENASVSTSTGKFLDKFIQQQTLHQQILQKLENQVPTSTVERIKEARETHLENFAEVMTKLENKEKIQERVEKNIEEVKGSEFKAFQNLEVLKNLEEKVPLEIKESLQRAQETTITKLQEKLEQMTPEKQEKFNDYVEKISGEKEKQMEILESLKTNVQSVIQSSATPKVLELKEKLEKGKTKILEKIEKKVEKTDCPAWTKPEEGFCKDGKIYIPKDPTTGCPLEPKCITPEETNLYIKPSVKTVPQVKQEGTAGGSAGGVVEKACATIWNPVCGKNGVTYSNSCYAKSAGVEINHEGACEKTSTLIKPSTGNVAPTQ